MQLGNSVNGPDLDIFGYINLTGNFDLNNGLIYIHDTLIVNGNFTLLNNGDLTIGDDGILIVFGDYLSYNQVQVSSGGYFIVTGEFCGWSKNLIAGWDGSHSGFQSRQFQKSGRAD